MTTYVVMEAESSSGRNAIFIRDRFSILAFFVPLVWLIWYRLWIEAALVLAAAIALAALGTVTGFESAAPLLSALVSLYVGLEGQNLRVSALQRRGFRQAAIIDAEGLEEAELRFFHAHPGIERHRMPHMDSPRTAEREAGQNLPLFGLLEYPDRK